MHRKNHVSPNAAYHNPPPASRYATHKKKKSKIERNQLRRSSLKEDTKQATQPARCLNHDRGTARTYLARTAASLKHLPALINNLRPQTVQRKPRNTKPTRFSFQKTAPLLLP